MKLPAKSTDLAGSSFRKKSDAKNLLGLCHTLDNLHAKGAVALTAAAGQAVAAVGGEGSIVPLHRLRQGVVHQGKVQELVHQGDVDMGRAGEAVVAVHALAPHGVFGRGREQGGVVLLLVGERKIPHRLVHLLQGSIPRQHTAHRRPGESIVDALPRREGKPKGGGDRKSVV